MPRLHQRPVVLVMVAALVLATVPAFTPASAAPAAATRTCKTVMKHGKKTKVCTTRRPPAPKPTPTPTVEPNDALAQRLAATLAAAGTVDAKAAALRAIFGAVRLGIYNAQTGAPIVRGAETSQRDLVLYDYDLTEMVNSLSRGDTRTLSDVAGVLTSLGIKPGGKPVDPDVLRRIVIAEVAGAVAHPSDPSSTLPLLIRDIGMHAATPYDLSSDVPLTSVQLNAVQIALLMAGILGPTVHAAPAATNASSARGLFHTNETPPAGPPGACHALAIVVAPFDPNTWIDLLGADHQSYVPDAFLTSQISDFVAALKAAETEVGAINMAYTVAIALHGMLLAFGIKIESLPDLRPITHYGPLGSNDEADAGKPITFRALVTMQDDVGKPLVDCLTEAGFTVPAQGPVENMPVDWHESVDDIEQYGTVAYQPADQKTGKDGISSMVLFPHNEKAPGFGTLVTKTGVLEPHALWGSYGENVLATVNQVLTPKLGQEFDWTVTYHKARGFRFLHLRWNWTGNFGVGYPDGVSSYDVSGHVCGDDPNMPWLLDVVESDNWPVYGANYNGTFEGAYELNGPLDVHFHPAGAIIATWITWGPSPLFHAHITAPAGSHDSSWVAPADQTVSVPIEEDKTCPDNSGS